jgi:hypothetical protein
MTTRALRRSGPPIVRAARDTRAPPPAAAHRTIPASAPLRERAFPHTRGQRAHGTPPRARAPAGPLKPVVPPPFTEAQLRNPGTSK